MEKQLLDFLPSLTEQDCDRLKKIHHDMRNHLIGIKMLLDSGNTKDAGLLLNNIIGQTDNISIDISRTSGNSIIDTITAFKAAVCENKNINLDYGLDALPKISIDYADVSSVISNLIDNAIEAAENTDNPYIKLRITAYGSYINIFVKNTYNGTLITDKSRSRLLTAKTDTERHGYGTQIVKEIAEKYDGCYSWKEAEGFFITSVLLKNN